MENVAEVMKLIEAGLQADATKVFNYSQLLIGKEHKEKLFGIDMSNIKVPIRFKVKMLNNCVEPKAGLSIFNQAFNDKQSTLGDP